MPGAAPPCRSASSRPCPSPGGPRPRSGSVVAACAARRAGASTTRSSTRAPCDDGARDPPPARVPRVRPPVHDLRAPRGGASHGGEAVGEREPFDRAKVVGGLRRRPRTGRSSRSRWSRSPPTSRRRCGSRAPRSPPSRSAWPCSSGCASLDDVAYLRFASVYKGFEDLGDFEREVALTKATEPKRALVGRAPSRRRGGARRGPAGSCGPPTGTSSSSDTKLRGSSTSRCIGVSAMTVAARGPWSSSDISPKSAPGPERGELLLAQRGRRLAVGDDERLAAGRALLGEHAARLDLDLVDQATRCGPAPGRCTPRTAARPSAA